jgi:hypothetical protein
MSKRSKRNSLSIQTNCDLYVPASSYSLKLSCCFG